MSAVRGHPARILLVNTSSMLARFAYQTKAWFDSFALTFDSGSNVLAYNWSMLETMTRTAADQPDIFKIRMKIDEEVAV